MTESIAHNKIKAVIFDLDDTLVSEYEFIVSGYKFISKRLSDRLGRNPDEINDKLWDLTKEAYSNMFNRLFDCYGEPYTDGEMQEIIFAYRNHPAKLQFYPDVKETLFALKKRGILMGIISDGDPARQRNKIRSAVGGLKNGDNSAKPMHSLHNSTNVEITTDASDEEIKYWFNEIILNDEFGGEEYRKPNPKGFAEIAKRLRADPSEMIYIGDNPAKDFHIAKDMPVRTARIIREHGIYNDRGYLDGIRETWRLDGLVDIIRIIDEANKA
ncbi:MAG: HAD-IA family hydrolase [Lachnospiraceae bacterium]|nr:HAD-IA family hydrolase [Lachnospiraceae bacterium]